MPDVVSLWGIWPSPCSMTTVCHLPLSESIERTTWSETIMIRWPHLLDNAVSEALETSTLMPHWTLPRRLILTFSVWFESSRMKWELMKVDSSCYSEASGNVQPSIWWHRTLSSREVYWMLRYIFPSDSFTSLKFNDVNATTNINCYNASTLSMLWKTGFSGEKRCSSEMLWSMSFSWSDSDQCSRVYYDEFQVSFNPHRTRGRDRTNRNACIKDHAM